MSVISSTSHSAADSAAGFYYQSLYALYSILSQDHDDATACVERLDDVEINTNGQSLLLQLKHSLSSKPPSVSISSRSLWRTFKSWIDIFPNIELDQTRFQLVTVAKITKGDGLEAFLNDSDDRVALKEALIEEATRIVSLHEAAALTKKTTLPYADKVGGCKAFLDLPDPIKQKFLTKVLICADSSNIPAISEDIQTQLKNFPPQERKEICKRLMEWWDLQIIFSLCDKRPRYISKLEALQKISEISADIARNELIPDFENMFQPADHLPDSMIGKQIGLIGGTTSDMRIAIRDEWRAREQRNKWCLERLDMATRISLYDAILQEKWQDKFERLNEESFEANDIEKRKSGRNLLHWSFESAHKEIRPFAHNWSASYYVCGSYQVLAIDLKVGWHPHYRDLLS